MLVYQSKLARLTPNLGILWISVCSFWLCGSIVANPIIYGLVPSLSRYEIRQYGLFFVLPLALKYFYVCNCPTFRKALLHDRANKNTFYWKFKRKFRRCSCILHVLKFSLECVLFCIPEYYGNAKGTLKWMLQERVPCWFFC